MLTENQKLGRRRHYQRNKSKYVARSLARHYAVRDWLRAYKSTLKCSRCPENHPACLEFHHLRDKLFDISESYVSHSIEDIKDEIAKCIVLCANCHNKEHYEEIGSPVIIDWTGDWRRDYDKNRSIKHRVWIRDQKKKCTRCEECHPGTLGFYKKDGTAAGVSNVFRKSLSKLQEIISECIVLCTNCHRQKYHLDKAHQDVV